ncbi:MAG: hypothetical protein ACE5JI_20665, partial [Acidobacteriota bacterium]
GCVLCYHEAAILPPRAPAFSARQSFAHPSGPMTQGLSQGGFPDFNAEEGGMETVETEPSTERKKGAGR